MSQLSTNLRFLRKKMGKSQAEISTLVNKKQNTIGNWENDVSEPAINELGILAEFFGVGIQDLLTTDLENGPESSGSETTPKKPVYPIAEGFSSTAQEASHQFWVLIGELRRVNEKLDAIKNQLDGKTAEKNPPPRSGL